MTDVIQTCKHTLTEQEIALIDHIRKEVDGGYDPDVTYEEGRLLLALIDSLRGVAA